MKQRSLAAMSLLVLGLAGGMTGVARAADDGYIDGIYQCEVMLEGKKSSAFLSLNGRKDGKTVYLVHADGRSVSGLYGYGLGLVSGQTFDGNTSFGKRFSFAVEFLDTGDADGLETVRLKGSVGMPGSNGKAVNAYVDCKSVW